MNAPAKPVQFVRSSPEHSALAQKLRRQPGNKSCQSNYAREKVPSPPMPMPDTPPPAFPSAEELGNSLLQYDVQECIQTGRESAIYRARQPALDRQVMIRLIAEPPMASAARLMERLRSRARLVHPRIIAVYDFGRTHAGDLYLITEHVDGRLLKTSTHSDPHGAGAF